LPWIFPYSFRFNEKIKSTLEIQQAGIVSLGRPDDPVSLYQPGQGPIVDDAVDEAR
jgi:hypothetical protein